MDHTLAYTVRGLQEEEQRDLYFHPKDQYGERAYVAWGDGCLFLVPLDKEQVCMPNIPQNRYQEEQR
jgi:hypothetical protein